MQMGSLVTCIRGVLILVSQYGATETTAILLYTIQSCNCITGTCVILGAKQGSFYSENLTSSPCQPQAFVLFLPMLSREKTHIFCGGWGTLQGPCSGKGHCWSWSLSMGLCQCPSPAQKPLASAHTKSTAPVSQATLTFTAFHRGQQTFTHFMLTIQTENVPNRTKKPYSLV